jgi:hypothetical protein
MAGEHIQRQLIRIAGWLVACIRGSVIHGLIREFVGLLRLPFAESLDSMGSRALKATTAFSGDR